MGLKFSERSFVTSGRYTNANDYDGYAITPNDTLATYQAQIPTTQGSAMTGEAIYVTGAGTVSLVLDAAGNTATVTAAAGSLIPVAFTQIKATGTTATGIFALFRIGG